MCEIEDRVANANGRFPCKYCNQNSVNQFMQWAMKRTHAKKANLTRQKPKLSKRFWSIDEPNRSLRSICEQFLR